MGITNTIYHMEGTTIVTGLTSEQSFLVCDLNDKQVGVPLFTFVSSSPEFDFVSFQPVDIQLLGATVVTSGVPYNAGVALYVNASGSAWPIYKVTQNTTALTPLALRTPTLVSGLTATGKFSVIRVNGTTYGVPLYNFNTEYPFTTTAPMSTIPIRTVLSRIVKDIGNTDPSTNLNSKIRTYRNLIDRIKYQLGAPFVNIEICEDSQIVDFIDQAIEWFTKYAGYTEEYLIFDSQLYTEPGLRIDQLFTITPTLRNTMQNNVSGAWDYDLGDYRRVAGCFSVEQGETTGINELFTLEQAMAQQTYFSYMLGNVGFDLITWEVLKGWLDTREKVLAQRIYYNLDERNQLLRLIPAPYANQRYWGIVGAFVEKPIRDIIMERWVYQYALALTKIAIGNIRGKFQNMQLFGGGVINYNDLLSQGLEEKKQLEEELMQGYGEVRPARFFIG